MKPTPAIGCLVMLCLLGTGISALGQRSRSYRQFAEDPAIRYSSAPVTNAIDTLNKRLDAGEASLRFEGRSGYLRSALQAIGLPIDSQLLVFSNASFQGNRISETNPRAIFFKDDVQLAWVRDADMIEVAAQDETLGVVFYTLQQKKAEAPRFKRAMLCLGCHMNGGTFEVPGLVMFSSTHGSGRPFGSVAYMTPSMSMVERFGGWFVTGAVMPADHEGNAVTALAGRSRALTSTQGLYDADGHVSSSSDIAALMVFAHQAQTVNQMIRAGWEARATGAPGHPAASAGAGDAGLPVQQVLARDLVDSLLFIDEARLERPVRGSSGFADRFAAEGPRDPKGRSLRQLDLTRRLMRYPCSYLIYSAMFDALPPSIKALIFERMWQVLSGAESSVRYRTALTLADRQAIVEILRSTKPGLPAYFTRVVN